MALNRIIIMGRMTRDPELRKTNSGTSVTSFTLAVDRPGKEKATDFIDCTSWKNTADFVNKYFAKGRMAVVEGRLQIRDWTDTNGNKRKTSEVVVSDIYFGDSKQADPLDKFTKDNAFVEVEDDDGSLPF